MRGSEQAADPGGLRSGNVESRAFVEVTLFTTPNGGEACYDRDSARIHEGGEMKWRVLWRSGESSLGLKVCDDIDQVKRVYDDRERHGRGAWIENVEGRPVHREELDRLGT